MVKTSSVVEPKKKKAANETDIKERSDNMDKNILEKRKRDEISHELEMKLLTEKKAQEDVAELERKNKKKLQNTSQNKDSDIIKSPNLLAGLPANVKELPPLIRCIYPHCNEYIVPGDGACCLNCLAAWIYLDAKQGPALSRDFNTHIA